MIRKAANTMKFQTAGNIATGYIAIPERGEGPGVLVLHAWWGLNNFFKDLCERLAQEGFVAVAPDLYDGTTASTIDEAKQLLSTLNFEETRAKVISAAGYVRDHPAVRGKGIGAIGFSLGGAWALLLSSFMPEDVVAVVVFYGSEAADFTAARAAYLGHFAGNDEWEPLEGIRQMERSEEHTSELQSHSDLVCRLLLEKKKRTLASAEAALVRLHKRTDRTS